MGKHRCKARVSELVISFVDFLLWVIVGLGLALVLWFLFLDT